MSGYDMGVVEDRIVEDRVVEDKVVEDDAPNPLVSVC